MQEIPVSKKEKILSETPRMEQMERMERGFFNAKTRRAPRFAKKVTEGWIEDVSED